jgi:chemotaxis signal transduction protein
MSTSADTFTSRSTCDGCWGCLPGLHRLVLFQSGVGTAFGVLVDEVGDIVTVEETQSEDLATSAADLSVAERAHLVTRLCKLPDELLAVLDPRRFLPLVEQALTQHS